MAGFGAFSLSEKPHFLTVWLLARIKDSWKQSCVTMGHRVPLLPHIGDLCQGLQLGGELGSPHFLATMPHEHPAATASCSWCCISAEDLGMCTVYLQGHVHVANAQPTLNIPTLLLRNLYSTVTDKPTTGCKKHLAVKCPLPVAFRRHPESWVMICGGKLSHKVLGLRARIPSTFTKHTRSTPENTSIFHRVQALTGGTEKQEMTLRKLLSLVTQNKACGPQAPPHAPATARLVEEGPGLLTENMTWICHCSVFIPGEHLPLSVILTQKNIISPLLGTGNATGTARVQEQLNTAFLRPSGKFPSRSKLCIFSPPNNHTLGQTGFPSPSHGTCQCKTACTWISEILPAPTIRRAPRGLSASHLRCQSSPWDIKGWPKPALGIFQGFPEEFGQFFCKVLMTTSSVLPVPLDCSSGDMLCLFRESQTNVKWMKAAVAFAHRQSSVRTAEELSSTGFTTQEPFPFRPALSKDFNGFSFYEALEEERSSHIALDARDNHHSVQRRAPTASLLQVFKMVQIQRLLGGRISENLCRNF
ncbi:hypothetical protein Anapl_17718 [Anas platyrhynchos]|uniref:Uncharacterized protein n=1 Tax=Anas platyrhynchos TaxID=8839 RepID=R0JWI2_ANAPL|nr:hypothetical protein Anapl_17718 [Anas platyrhynchos]